ncbi:hypothetical protein, partial [Celeribacter baekdonensis]|uniref:hypothetical protein n=1 Tax=Celeribacter baekdonensis TaxID=875171 RepID=UPI0030D91364
LGGEQANLKRRTFQGSRSHPAQNVFHNERLHPQVDQSRIGRIGGVGALPHKDQLGSVKLITAEDGSLVKTSTYAPFGEAFDEMLSLARADETKGNTCERYDADAGLFSWGNAPPEPFLIPLQPQRPLLRPPPRPAHPARLARSYSARRRHEQVQLFRK